MLAPDDALSPRKLHTLSAGRRDGEGAVTRGSDETGEDAGDKTG